MNVIRGRHQIVVPVASIGIAATLLKGGRTYHHNLNFLFHYWTTRPLI
jgi:hypothetical protein